MARIQTLEQFRDYVKLMCGMPVIQLEVDDMQIDQIIEDSIDIMCRYLYEEATYLDYAVVTLSAGVQEIPTSAVFDSRAGRYLTNVHDVYDFNVSFGLDGINTMFSPTNILLYDQYVNKGNYPGGPGGGYDTGMTMTNYHIAMGYLKEIQNTFSKRYTINYLPASDIFQVIPTPAQDLVGVLSFYRRETTENLYNHILMKQLVVAKTKKIWGGLNIGKYAATLPDGTTINYRDIYEQGKEEEEKILDRIDNEGAPCDFFIA